MALTSIGTAFYTTSSAIGALSGASASIAFLHLGNNYAVLWALLTWALASLCLHIHVLYVRNKMDEYYTLDLLRHIENFGFFSGVICAGFFFWYLFRIAYEKVPIYAPVSDSIVIICVWTFLTMKYGFFLKKSAWRYIKMLEADGRPMLQV